MPPKKGQYYAFRGYPFIIIQLNVNLTAKKKKKKSRNQKRDESHEEETEETIFYEPNLDTVEEVLLMPF